MCDAVSPATNKVYAALKELDSLFVDRLLEIKRLEEELCEVTITLERREHEIQYLQNRPTHYEHAALLQSVRQKDEQILELQSKLQDLKIENEYLDQIAYLPLPAPAAPQIGELAVAPGIYPSSQLQWSTSSSPSVSEDSAAFLPLKYQTGGFPNSVISTSYSSDYTEVIAKVCLEKDMTQSVVHECT